ncbi:hypothetical protein N072000002_09530 [Clostridium tetani]|uniref:Phage tail tape measure protein domain-containing protein n=1 Tax=Clostridium tetani TaxID=1513 RepID=A0ABC8EBU8_CLOTA|nr:phage tail tape measure protein [Clostridium tetani]BDR80697.1 hypothetical protein K234311028_09430 [Clostridium tetani]BDR89152.1 hypothetical protein N072000002_09530 [Clostridium tetani]
MASNTEKRVTAKMVLDSTGYNSSIKGINSEMKKHQAELKLASEGIKTFGKDSEKLKSVQESLSKQVELHSKKVDIYRQSIEKAKNKMQENIKERDKLKESLDKANRKYDETVKLYGKESEQAKKAKEEVDRLTQEHKKASKAVETNAKQVQNYESNMNKANAQMVRTEGELRRVNEELVRSNNKWLQASEGLKKHSEKLKDIGGKVTNVGKNLTTHVSLPLAGVGIAASKVGMDFEAQMSKVQAISGATGEDFNKLKAKAEEMGSKTKFSAKESAEGLEYMATAGWKTQDMLDGLPPILNLATAAGADLGQTSDIVTDALTAFGLKAKDSGHFSDILASASSNANTNVLMMGESFKYAAPIFGSVGYTAEDAALAIGLMANSGIKGTQSGTALRSMITRLVKPTKESAQAMKILGLKITDSSGKMKPFNVLMDEMRNSFAKLNPEQKASVAAQLAGQEAMSGLLSIVNAAPEDYNKLKGAINTCDGATDKMAETMSNNAKGSITEMKSALEGAGIKIFKVVAPSITNLAKEVTKMADKFSKLNPKTQETIVKMAALGIATGPVVGGIGKTITGVGNLAGGLSKLTGWLGKTSLATKGASVATGVASKGMGAMGLATKASTLLLNPWAIGIGAVTLAGVGLAKHLKKDAVPSVDLFADKVEHTTEVVTTASGELENKMVTTTTKISEETKKQVGAYMELDKGAEKSLTDLYVNGTKISDKTSKSLTETYIQMTTQIKTGMDKHYNNQVETLKKFLNNSKNITKEEQQKMLGDLKKHNEKQKREIDSYEKRIKEIMNKASKENRELKKEEQQEINSIQEKMRTNAVKTLSASEVEQKVIMERLKSYSSRITAEQASVVIKNAEKQKQESVSAAEKQYDETVRNIIKMRDETKTITHDQAEKLIEEAERQKEESITKAGEMKKTVVQKIKEMNEDSLKNIDETDGHIMTKWESLKNWFANNPIIRWIKTKTSGGGGSVDSNWTGNNYFRGGLTTLHERGEEIYDLPKGTRIYNVERSEQMVLETAEQVATKVANSVLNGFNGGTNGINVTQNIYSPTPSPSEVARQTKNSLRGLALNF